MRPAAGRALAAAVSVLVALVAAAAAARPQAVPSRAVITTGSDRVDPPAAAAAMERAVAGVLAVLDARGMKRLRQAMRPGGPAARRAATGGGGPVCVIHLSDIGRPRSLRVLDAGDVYVAEDTDGDDAAVVFDRPAFDRLLAEGPRYRGRYDTDVPPGRGDMPRPYVAADVVMGRRTMERRIYRGMNVEAADADRVLADERMHVRVPAGYDPRRPAGLLVWASPTPDGRVPAVLDTGLDELGLVAVGVDDIGNDRDVPDKLQLVLDAAATARRHYHVNPERVYVAGFSGGGKVASILTICFPEQFAGAVAIGGLGTHAALDETWGEHRRPYFARPAGHVLARARQRPIVAVTGPDDFNHDEIAVRIDRLRADGFDGARLLDCPGLGHALPPPGRLAEALRSVDEPARARRAAEAAEARQLLRAYLAAHPVPSAATPADRAALRRIMDAAPFSEPAWQALALLGADSDLADRRRGDQ